MESEMDNDSVDRFFEAVMQARAAQEQCPWRFSIRKLVMCAR
jgi:hypothetical protein